MGGPPRRRRAPRSPRGCAGCAERDPDGGSLSFRPAPGTALALRLEADRAERAAARRAAEEVAEARRRAAPIAWPSWTGSPPHRRRRPATLASPATCCLPEAERSRLEGRSDPERWQAAATAWERLERPFDAAYARFREAEALLADGAPRQQAETVLRAAHQTTVALGAATAAARDRAARPARPPPPRRTGRHDRGSRRRRPRRPPPSA